MSLKVNNLASSTLCIIHLLYYLSKNKSTKPYLMKKLYILFLLAFATSLSFSQISIITYSFAGNYTYTIPPGVTTLSMEVYGGGGKGQGNGTGGGGGGGYSFGVFTVTPGATLAVHIGTNGVNPTANTSSITGYIIATGGANGVSVANPTVGGGGTGGIGSGGSINSKGGDGGGGYYTYFGGGGGAAGGPAGNGNNGGNCIAYSGSNCLQPGGSGGSAPGYPTGAGGKGAGFLNSGCTQTDPAGNGGYFGGGGGGGNGIGSTPGAGGGGGARLSFTTAATGITELAKSNVVVFPNPFTSKLNIQASTGNETFELVNALGQQIFIGKNIEEQDFSAITKGVYFLKVQNTSTVIKLVKQ